MMRLGTSSRRMLDSVFVLRRRVMIRRLPSKKVLEPVGRQRLHVRVCQSGEHREDEEVAYQLTGPAFHRGLHQRLYLTLRQVAPINALGELMYPAKGLKGSAPLLRAMEMTCLSPIMYPHTVLVRHFFSVRRKYSKLLMNVRLSSFRGYRHGGILSGRTRKGACIWYGSGCMSPARGCVPPS